MAAALHDLVVLSDLHLGRGRNAETGRYHGLEAFFYDDDFVRFCRFLVADARAREQPLKVVFNGDVFDFLRIEPDEGGARKRGTSELGPPEAARLLEQILAGHPGFVDGVAQLLDRKSTRLNS